MLTPLSSTLARTSALLALTLSTCLCAQTTINVGPGQTHTTIQSGIDAANAGDTVLVAPGTYFENIDFKGKAITVTSSGGTAQTIIDGGGVGPAVIFQTSEPRTSVLSNMTIQHGGSFTSSSLTNTGPTGGIYISGSSPTILNNTITQNNCWDIEMQQAAPLIQGNEISATQDPNGQCTFGGGAAIYIGGNLNGDSVPGNLTSPFLIGNTIENNVESGLEDAGGNGGAGIAVWGGSPFIEDNIIRNNSSPGGSGGAINFEYGSGATVIQNLIYNNQAGCGGGAIAFQGNPDPGTGLSFVIANNTMINNTGQSTAGFSECFSISQIYPGPDSYGDNNPTAIFVNNIISGSTTDPSVDCSQFGPLSEADQPIFDHNILYNAGGAFFGSFCVDVSAKYGNLAADPQLVNAASGDFKLQSTSPAIDSGNNSVLQSITQLTGTQIAKDFAGNPRVQDATDKGYPIIDMGAYEYSGVVDASPTTVVLTSSAYTGNAGTGYTLTATLASALGSPTGNVAFFLDNKQIGTSTISNGVAKLTNFLITPGVHALYASYPGQGSFPPAFSVIIIVDISTYTTTLTLTSSPNPSLLNQPVTFTVTAAAADKSIPTPITLTDTTTNTPLATLTPNSTGAATFTTSTLSLGAHGIEAAYAGTSTYASSSAFLTQQVVGSTTTTTLTCNPSTITIGGTSLFSVMVTSSGGTPTGSITFTDNNSPLGQPTLTNGDATYTYTGQTTGTHGIIATYIPTGSFAASSSSCSVTVNGLPTTTTVAVSPNPSTYGQPIIFSAHVAPAAPNKTVPTGRLRFTFCRGATIDTTLDASGNSSVIQPYAGEISEPVGSCSVTGQYFGDTTFAPSTSATAPYTIVPSPSTTTILSASPNPAYFTQPVSFTVQIAGIPSPTANPVTGQPIPPGTLQATGTVSLYDGTVLVGSAQVVAGPSGNQAVITTSTLSIGTHTITASYSDDPNLGNSVSAPVTEVITAAPPPDFSLNSANITFNVLHSGTGNLQLASINNFAGNIALSCNPPYPVNYTCTLQSPSVSLTAGGSSVVAFNLNYTETASVSSETKIILAAFFPLTLLSLTGLTRKRRTTLRAILSLTLLAILATATTACGSNNAIPITTGTFPLTFTATGASQGASTPITHTVTINATIAP
jgi:hypothetical protein